MAIKCICFVLLVMYVPISESKICQISTLRNETKGVCCADYEKRGYDCIACLKGYISDIGQNCKPCPKNTYGERCRYDCSCSDFEVCDNVKGCVQFSPTTGSSFVTSSDTFIHRISNKSCEGRTTSDKKEKVCCADFEEKESGCIACLAGYTSDRGQHCRPCSKNLYGDRCRYTCYCSGYEICDHIKGCVKSSPTTAASFDTTSHDMLLTLIPRPATDYVDDTTTCQTNVQNTDGDFSSREIIAYITIPLIVVVLVICVCFIFCKYKVVDKKKKITIAQKPSLLHNRQDTEIQERLYDTIGDTNMLRYLQQMLNESTIFSGENQIVESCKHSLFNEGLQKTKQQC